MRKLGILLASSALVFAANGFAQESTSAAHQVDIKALTGIIKASPTSSEAKTALQQLEQAADSGDKGALMALGYAYNSGNGVAKDPAKAVELFQIAADRGDKGALVALGYAYNSGNGVAKDPAKGSNFSRKRQMAETRELSQL